jgi:hypothetical protein
MVDVVMVSDGTQALTIPHHPDRFPLLMRGQFGLRSEFHTSFLGGSSPPIRASKNAASFVLSKGGKEGQDAAAKWGGQIEPLPIERLEGCSSSCDTLDDPDAFQHRSRCAVPLREHQHVALPQGLACPFPAKIPPTHVTRDNGMTAAQRDPAKWHAHESPRGSAFFDDDLTRKVLGVANRSRSTDQIAAPLMDDWIP